MQLHRELRASLSNLREAGNTVVRRRLIGELLARFGSPESLATAMKQQFDEACARRQHGAAASILLGVVTIWGAAD